MSESENALPLDDSFWEHVKHLDFSIGIPISDTKMLNILGALKDIFNAIMADDKEDAKMCVTALGAMLVASKYGKADAIWEEFSVREAMTNFDEHMKEILDDNQR